MHRGNAPDRDPDRSRDAARAKDVMEDAAWQVKTGRANAGNAMDAWALRIAKRMGIHPADE